MKTSIRVALCLALLLGLSAWNVAQETAPSEITITVPEKGHSETVVKVNGKEVKGEGDTRTFKAKLEKGESFLIKDELEALKAAKVLRDFQTRERERKGTREFASRKVGKGMRIWRVR